MKKYLSQTLFFILLFAGINATAQIELFKKEMFVQGMDTLPYRILYPDNYQADKSYPLILLLHGSGERGNDNELQLKHGGRFFSSSETRAAFPAIVVFPQCSSKSFWAAAEFPTDSNGNHTIILNPSAEATTSMQLLQSLVDQLKGMPQVDPKRIYLGGISMGGMGTFELLFRQPDVFAAAFPICGGGNPSFVDNYAQKVKIWAFHGAKDVVVPVQLTKGMVDAVNAIGGEAKITVYPEGNHDVWNNVFAEPQLLDWLFSVRKE